MKKSFYLVGSVLSIIVIGIVVFSGCSRIFGTSGESSVNSNTSQTQSSSNTQNTKTQQSTGSSSDNASGTAKAVVSDGVQSGNNPG